MRKETSSDQKLIIIGGAAAAIHLINEIDQTPGIDQMSIVLLDPSTQPEGGSPHADPSPSLRVNMAAEKHDFRGQMSFAEHRENFGGDNDPPSRHDLGRYLFHVKDQVVKSLIQKDFSVVTKRQRAVSITRLRSDVGRRWRIDLQNGEQITADLVVLATGHNSPSLPSNVLPVDGTTERISFYDGGSSFSKKIARSDRILILGTGPGATDAARVLIEDVGVWQTITLASTHGLLSAVQCADPPSAEILSDVQTVLDAMRAAQPLELPQLGRMLKKVFDRFVPGFDYSSFQSTPPNAFLQLVRCIEEGEANAPGREVLEAIGQVAPQIWRCLSDTAKSEFLRSHKRQYMANRHAMPSSTAGWLAAMLAKKNLQIAKTLSPIEVFDDTIMAMVNLLPGGDRALTFDRLVIATGPEYRLSRSKNPLIQQILQTGLAKVAKISGEEVGGFQTKDFELTGMDGVFAMGSLAFGEDLAIHSFPALQRHASVVVSKIRAMNSVTRKDVSTKIESQEAVAVRDCERLWPALLSSAWTMPFLSD